jgi:hypothetical protein
MRPVLRSIPTLAALAALLATALPAEAQLTRSILELLPTDGRVVEVGASAMGALGSPDDFHFPDGQPVQAWEVRGAPGSWVWIDLVSDDFDAFLWVLDPARRELLLDDDSGGGCNARIPVEIPAGGSVVAVASQVGLRVAGAFSISVATEEPPFLEEPCAYSAAFGDGDEVWWTFPDDLAIAGTIPAVPGELTAALAAGDGVPGPLEGPLVTWEVELAVGQTVQVDLESDDFDAILLVTGPGFDGALIDDDGGDGTNARYTFTALEAGTHYIHVTTHGPDQSGSYRLRIVDTGTGGG